MAQVHSPTCDQLRVMSEPEITLTAFQRACAVAAEMNADVVIVDHVDHIAAGNGTNLYAESIRVNRQALKMAQDLGLLLVLTSQLNTDSVRGRDHLMKFAPPREQDLKFGGHKREISTGMLGLFRPLRRARPDEDADDFKRVIKLARAGELEPRHVLMPDTMGVVLMKDRNYGRDGLKTLLAVMNGRVEDRDERRDDMRYSL